jgi:hypothetical protein
MLSAPQLEGHQRRRRGATTTRHTRVNFVLCADGGADLPISVISLHDFRVKREATWELFLCENRGHSLSTN